MTHFSFKWHICLFMSAYYFLFSLSAPSSLSIPPSSISLPSQACSCCVRWTGMMASVSGSMRTLFAACTLNTQLLHPSLLICYFFSCLFLQFVHVFPSLLWLSLLPVISIFTVLTACPFAPPSLANPASSICILSSHACNVLLLYCAACSLCVCVWVCVCICVCPLI